MGRNVGTVDSPFCVVAHRVPAPRGAAYIVQISQSVGSVQLPPPLLEVAGCWPSRLRRRRAEGDEPNELTEAVLSPLHPSECENGASSADDQDPAGARNRRGQHSFQSVQISSVSQFSSVAPTPLFLFQFQLCREAGRARVGQTAPLGGSMRVPGGAIGC